MKFEHVCYFMTGSLLIAQVRIKTNIYVYVYFLTHFTCCPQKSTDKWCFSQRQCRVQLKPKWLDVTRFKAKKKGKQLIRFNNFWRIYSLWHLMNYRTMTRYLQIPILKRLNQVLRTKRNPDSHIADFLLAFHEKRTSISLKTTNIHWQQLVCVILVWIFKTCCSFSWEESALYCLYSYPC